MATGLLHTVCNGLSGSSRDMRMHVRRILSSTAACVLLLSASQARADHAPATHVSDVLVQSLMPVEPTSASLMDLDWAPPPVVEVPPSDEPTRLMDLDCAPSPVVGEPETLEAW